MAKPNSMPIDVMRQLITYDPNTGHLFWRYRPESLFPDQRACKIWNSRFAGKKAGCIAVRGYIEFSIFRKHFKAHRVAWALHYGEWPSDIIDHINGDATDNRIENLRDVGQLQNAQNQKMNKRNKSGVAGAHWCSGRNRWVAQIKANGTHIPLGRYKCLTAAAIARKVAEVKHGFHERHGTPF